MIEQDNHNQNLEIWYGTTPSYELKFIKDGSCLDITDWMIYFTVKSKIEDDDSLAVISKDISEHSAPLEGKTLIQLTTSETARTGSYYYDIVFKDDAGNVGLIKMGRISFKKKVTLRE